MSSSAVFLRARSLDDGTLKRIPVTAFGTGQAAVSSKAGRLYLATITNTSATAYYVHVFDSFAPVTTGAVPIWIDRLPASLSVTLDFGIAGLYAATGLRVGISTTGPTYTAAASNDAVLSGLFTANT